MRGSSRFKPVQDFQGVRTRRAKLQTAGVHSAVFSSDGRRVLTASTDNTARLLLERITCGASVRDLIPVQQIITRAPEEQALEQDEEDPMSSLKEILSQEALNDPFKLSPGSRAALALTGGHACKSAKESRELRELSQQRFKNGAMHGVSHGSGAPSLSLDVILGILELSPSIFNSSRAGQCCWQNPLIRIRS
jgi:hypothetical protein